MKALLLDIETAPNVAYVWGLFDQNISGEQVESAGYVLCWSAKWLGHKTIDFRSVRQPGGARRMLREIHGLIDEADAVIHYNGRKFDMPTLNKEFVRHKIAPPSPYRQIDLMAVCKQAFRFESNRLQYVSQALGIGSKVHHEGFRLWTRCMAGDREAWRIMERYNRGDVELLEALYWRLLPWIDKHPSRSALTDVECCPRCGSTKFQRRGEVMTATLRYARYQCVACAGWFRGTGTVSKGAKRMVAA